MNLLNRDKAAILLIMAGMAIYFLLGRIVLMDDGVMYQGFAEALSRGVVDFRSYYGFQGLSILAVPIIWLTQSPNSIVFTSVIFTILSIPLMYLLARNLHASHQAGIIGVILFLLMPYPYVTLMRGFQEAALLFFILLIIYGSTAKKVWTPLAWAIGGIVKPFALTLAPLLLGGLTSKWLKINILLAFLIGGTYLTTSYIQTGHLINNAAINSYQGAFDTGNPPPLVESFAFQVKGFARVAANFLIPSRKILIAPSVILIGLFGLFTLRDRQMRKRFTAVIVLNVLLVGFLTFSFPKYLLPAAVIFLLASIPVFERSRWLWPIVFIDSFFVFKYIYLHFGIEFWPSFPIYLIPYYCGIGLVGYLWFNQIHHQLLSNVKKSNHHPHS